MILYEKFLIVSRDVQFTDGLSNYAIMKQNQYELDKSIQLIRNMNDSSFIFKQNNQLYTVRTEDREGYKTFSCSCNKRATCGYPCIHEVKAFKLTSSKNYQKEFHPSFKIESYEEYEKAIEKLPQISFDNLKANENITKCISVNKKKFSGKRKKCGIDFKKNKN